VERCSIQKSRHFFEPGTVPMFNPGEVHDGGPATASGWSYRMVYLDASLVGGERVFPVAARRDPMAWRSARQLFDAIDCGSQLGIEEALVRALDVLLINPENQGKAPPLDKVRERIDAQCCEPLRLRDLCGLAEVSPTRLLRGFEAAYGLTPHRYQQSRRIARAKKLILAGTALAEVAAACGYSDQTHLNRWFRRIQGTTPGRFRRAFFS
jgi:AraC-like DNA-binding protein